MVAQSLSIEVSTGSGSDRVTLCQLIVFDADPVATAPGIDLILLAAHRVTPALSRM